MKLTKQILKLALVANFFLAFGLNAHGEHKPGPHGGEIRMPGAFHTEVSSYQNLGFKVYLLDINFENPSTYKSSVSGKIVANGRDYNLKCSSHPDHFYCEIPKGSSVKEGELILSPIKDGNKGAEAKYKLPLREKSEHNHG